MDDEPPVFVVPGLEVPDDAPPGFVLPGFVLPGFVLPGFVVEPDGCGGRGRRKVSRIFANMPDKVWAMASNPTGALRSTLATQPGPLNPGHSTLATQPGPLNPGHSTRATQPRSQASRSSNVSRRTTRRATPSATNTTGGRVTLL